jgi:RNA ligase
MNLETLNKYYEDGLLYKQTHPTLPLTIWNYTEKVQYEMLWDEVTIACRGLVTDDSGVIIARPFPKFFNYEEVIDKNAIPWDSEYVYVQEKMDGSLGILFNYKGEWILATRGSFTSDQAVKGLEILKSKYDLKRFVPNVTYLCEIIYPENRVVVVYGKDMITFLGATTPERELNWGTTKTLFRTSGIAYEDVVWTAMDKLTEDLFKRYQNLNESDKEGFVIRFYPSDYRVKIKFEEYVRLHKIMTNFSTRNIWETLANGEDLTASLIDVPDEFHEKIKAYVDELTSQFETLEREYKWIFKILNRSITEVYNVPKEKQRSVFAQYAKNYKYPAILFKMLDGRDYTKIIWDLLYPEYRKI